MIKILKKSRNTCNPGELFEGELGTSLIELPIVKNFLFPGGEVGIQIDDSNIPYNFTNAAYQTIVARIQDSNDVMRLLNAVDALRRLNPLPIKLFMPYVPYSRQDRACNPGEAFSLGVFANLINSLNFESVTICDPHSDVSPAVFHNCKVISNLDIISAWPELREAITQPNVVFISPDAGANKKTSVLAKEAGHSEFVRADKLRDLSNGQIKETIVYSEDLTGETIVIADDICDGGRTFIELAKVLKAKNAAKVILYVTHGIFSKGVKPLFEGGIDEIYTTNSFNDMFPIEIEGKLKIFNVEKFL